MKESLGSYIIISVVLAVTFSMGMLAEHKAATATATHHELSADEAAARATVLNKRFMNCWGSLGAYRCAQDFAFVAQNLIVCYDGSRILVTP